MKKAFAIIVISLLCVSTFSILTPKVIGWAFGLHGAMANDALTGMGWSNQVGTYANDVDLYFPHPGSSNHRVGKYQVLYQNLGGDPCNYQGAEYWARIYIASARNSYLSNNMADAERYLGYAIHYIEDAVCPPHVFPFSEEFIWWAPLSWQLVSLETAPHANFEAETLVGYGIKNWPSLVRNAEPALIADLSDLETKIVQAADRVYALPCDYVRQNDHPIADDNDVVGDPSHVTGWSMLDENIGKCMVEAASLVKGAAIYVRGGRSGGPDHFGYTYVNSKTPGGPIYDWIEIATNGRGIPVLPDSDDSWVGNIDLGFFFNYYGTDYSQIAIGNNGLLFSGVGTWEYINQPITQTPSIHGFIAPYWDDIVTWGTAGAIYYAIAVESDGTKKFVVEWYDNQHYSSSSLGITFEAILYEGSNNILFQYKDVDFGSVYGAVGGDNPPYNNGGSATVGIEDPTGIIGLQYSFNEQEITPGLAILYKFPAFAGMNLYLSMNAPASMDHGNTMAYTLYYNDFGSIEAHDVKLEATISSNVDFVSASDGGTHDPVTRKVTWNIGTIPAYPSGRGSRTITVTIPSNVPVGTVTQTTAYISTHPPYLETRYDDNSASAQTTVTGSNLPPNVGVGPTLGNPGGTPSVYWSTPITFTYYSPTAISVNIRIHLDDGGPDITGIMTGGPPTWTYTTTFYPRHGHATATYTVNDPTPYFADFDLRNMRGFENTITAAQIENYIRSVTPNSPMVTEAGIGQRFIDAGRNNNVNPAFLVATAQLEGVFGTQGWAAAHPDAHNTMGWGIYPGHMDEDWEGLDRNAFASWGDGVAHVAWRIGAPDGSYYGAGWHTVGEIRTVYAGEPAIQTIVNCMNALARSAGQAGVFDVNFNLYVDPAGYIYDVVTLERILGASVWLQRSDGQGGWENVPTGQAPPIMQPDVNPQITGADGQYQWDVLEGSYRVHVEAPGYYPADSIVVNIPPPVTDLHVGLTQLPPPPDPIPPITTRTIGDPKYTDPSDNVFVTSDTQFTLTAEDNVDGSGVATTGYRIHNAGYDSGWASSAPPIEFYLTGLADGEYSIGYNSTDNAGNIEPTKIQNIILDNTPPTTIPTIGDPKYVSGKTYVTPDTPFTLTATDAGSGVQLITYRINSTSYDSGWLTYTAPFQLTSLTDGDYTIAYNSTDNVKNTETTHAISVTLFSWNYIYQDTYGRGTTLKINLAHKFFQFIRPDKDYGIRNATCMKQGGRAIIISHCDTQLRLITVSVDTRIDFCYAMAWDLQTRKCYLLIDKTGIE